MLFPKPTKSPNAKRTLKRRIKTRRALKRKDALASADEQPYEERGFLAQYRKHLLLWAGVMMCFALIIAGVLPSIYMGTLLVAPFVLVLPLFWYRQYKKVHALLEDDDAHEVARQLE